MNGIPGGPPNARRIVVLGSTGLLGRALVPGLTDAGYAVLGVSRSGRRCPERPEVPSIALDVAAASPERLEELFRGADAVVHGLGPDDRERPPRPASDYFRRGLVEVTERVAGAARRAGVARLVILGSYFTTVVRDHPEYRLPEHHPYIAARVDQARRATLAAGPGVAVSVLEIPFVFGIYAGMPSIWRANLFDVLLRMPVGTAPRGSLHPWDSPRTASSPACARRSGEPTRTAPDTRVGRRWLSREARGRTRGAPDE